MTALFIQAGPQVPVPVDVSAAGGPFEAVVPLVPGPQSIVVVATDVGGNEAVALVQVERVVDPNDTTAPSLQVTAPDDGFSVFGDSVFCAGTSADDTGVVSVTVQVDDGVPMGVETDDAFATWVINTPLSLSASQTLRFVAADLAGNVAEIVLTGGTSMVGDAVAPSVTITSPDPGATIDAATVTVIGTASDNEGVAAVDVRIADGPYLPAETSDGYAHWARTLPITPGDNLITVRATDTAGITTTATVQVYEPSIDAWGAPTTVTLAWQEALHTPSTFELDRAGVEELIVPSVAEQIVMMELEVEPLIASTIDLVRGACGPNWTGDVDLSGNCPESWGAPEINLWRLVTMTPANANVAGTSVEGMQEMADTVSGWGLTDNFADILSAALDIAVEGQFLTDEAVASALADKLVSTHPNVAPGGLIPVTLQDALTDMTSFGPRFGPQGDHPGFLVPDAPPYAEVLTEDFMVSMTSTSNVHWHDGVQLGHGKGYIALLDDQTGPTYDDVLEFDFLSPETFWIQGVADDPKATLTMQMFEHDGWVPIGNAVEPQPRGNGDAWSLDPWMLEHVMAEAAYRTYAAHRAGCDLCDGAETGALLYEVPLVGLDEAEIVVGRSGYDKDGNGASEHFPFIATNPAGWFRSWTLFGLGSPPQPQYVWDMILEIAERRLRDGDVPEGEGHVSFELSGVQVGMSAEELEAAVRPNMEAQKSALSELILGDYGANGDPVDFYLTKATSGQLVLTFIDASDPVPSGTAEHASPGFFTDPQLTTKASSLDDAGVHEALTLTAIPQLVYSAAVDGTVYQITTEGTDGDNVTLTLRPWVGSEAP